MQRYGLLVIAVVASLFANSVYACEGRYSSEVQQIAAVDRAAWITSATTSEFTDRVAAETARNARIREIEAAGGLCVAKDYLAAAGVRSRGFSIEDTLAAIRLSSVAISLDPSSVEAKAVFGQAIDRLSFQSQGKQIYGTLVDHSGGKATTLPVLDGAVSEDERRLVQSVPYIGFASPSPASR